MRKGWIVLLACALVAMIAMPAAADVNLNGFYRSKGYVSNFKSYSPGTTAPQIDGQDGTFTYVEQRMRLRFTVGDENVKAVSFFELDSMWGDTSAAVARNQGAALGADGINIESKNLFLWFKVPNTSLDFTVGLQNQSDSYAGLFFGLADFAGVFANAKMDPVALRLGFGKWFENTAREADDVDLYLAEVKLSPVKDFKLGLNFYVLNDRGEQGRQGNGGAGTPGDTGLPNTEATSLLLYMPGVDLTAKAGPATISAFAFYQFGTFESDVAGVQDIDVNGFAADVRADLALGPGKLFVEAIYISGDDDPSDTDFESILTASDYSLAQGFFARTDMQLLLVNVDDINTLQALTVNPNAGGRGLMHAAVGYSMKFTDKLGFKVGAGYAQVAQDRTTDQGDVLGTELNANLNFNISKGLDFGLYGAYAFLGDFYDRPSGQPEFVDPYDLHFRINYAF